MKRKFIGLCTMVLLGLVLTGCSIATDDDLATVQNELDGIVLYDDQVIQDELLELETSIIALQLGAYDDETLQLTIASLQTALANLQTTVSTLGVYDDTELVESITLIGTSLENLSTSNTELNAQLTLIESSIFTLTADLVIAQAAIESIDLSVILDRITALETEVASLESSPGSSNQYDYIYDTNGDYITFENLMKLLIYKYFGVTEEDLLENQNLGNFYMNSGIDFNREIQTEIIEPNEQFALYILMLNELVEYEFYYSRSTYIHMFFMNYIDDVTDNYFYFQIPTLLFDIESFEISVDAIFSETYDIEFNCSGDLNQTDAESIYDAYILAGTFEGYVLDFE